MRALLLVSSFLFFVMKWKIYDLPAECRFEWNQESPFPARGQDHEIMFTLSRVRKALLGVVLDDKRLPGPFHVDFWSIEGVNYRRKREKGERSSRSLPKSWGTAKQYTRPVKNELCVGERDSKPSQRCGIYLNLI